MGFSESDLTDCLRQCGFNVNTAAERLITGEYTRGAKKAFLKMTATSPDRKNSNGSNKVRKSFAASSLSSRSTSKPKQAPFSAPTTKKKTPIQKSPPSSAVKPIDLCLSDDDYDDNDEKNAENQRNKATPISGQKKKTNAGQSKVLPIKNGATKATASVAVKGRWLLCQRWISDAICTSRRGAMIHNEIFATEASGETFLRLRGRHLEGRFPDHIGRLLNPLLREDLVQLEAHSLMQEKNLPIGASIPVSLNVYLPDPVRFFEVFQNDSSMAVESSITMLWNMKKGKTTERKGQHLLERAAFDLLQWAHYGDVPDFSANATADEPEEGEAKGEELDEDDFEKEAEGESTEMAKQWSESVTSAADKTAHLSECEQPPGLKEVELRPYQKQALAWMHRREVESWSRQEQDEQLALLAELSRISCKRTVSLSLSDPTTDDIVCECGPVQVSYRAREQAKTCNGETNPVGHPLWQRRFLTDPERENVICFFVNEFMGVASHRPACPPQPCSGGILADSMGLGKTVMLLSLILRAKQEQKKGSPSATLVVAKLSLLPQWEEEIRSKTNLKFAVYYGAQASREYTIEELQNVDVVLTTYGTMQGELKRKNPLLTQCEWLRCILDEAHCVRNQNTIASKACCAIKARHRWAVSGTIMMNSMQDLYGIMKFLQHEPWCLPPFWKEAISKPMLAYEINAQNENADEQAASLQVVLNRLRRVLAPIMLRRTKDSLTRDGKPILTLPPVETQTVYVELSPTEREFYQAVLARSQRLFEGFVDAGTASKSYLQILSMISRLRQCCDHISLTVRNRLGEVEQTHEENENMESENATTPKKPSNSEEQKDLLGKDFLQGLMSKLAGSPKRKQQNIALEDSPSPSKRPRDSYLQSVASALSQAVENQETHTTDECPICLDLTPIAATVVTPCGHQFCKQCLTGYLVGNAPTHSKEDCPDGSCPVCQSHVEAKRVVTLRPSDESPGGVESSYLTAPSPDKTKIKKEVPESPEAEDTRMAKMILQDAVDGRVDSAKMTAVLEELQRVWELDPGSKVLIFSQFLGFLDLLQPRLAAMGIPFFRLDGQLTLSERCDVLKQFKSAARPKGDGQKGSVMLISMNAGGEGLNLVSASTVMIVDPWWNAAKEDQCINRVVRLGQTASVCRVRKFVVRQSVEERIVELQTRKKYMADELYETVGRAAGAGAMGGGARLTLEDLQVLFQG